MSARRVRDPDVLRISSGDPDLEAPSYVKEAAIKAIQEGGKYTHYAPADVTNAFQKAVCDYYSKYDVIYEPSQVNPTAGSGVGLYLVMAGLLKPGDECLVFDPTFGSHFRIPPELGAKVVSVPLNKGDFHLDPEEFSKRVTPNSKMLVLCNPNNPAGTVFTKDELKAISEICVKNDIIVLADEIYNEFLFDGHKHYAIAAIDGMKERTVLVMSFSKTFAMTGWRLGYYVLPKELESKWKAIPARVQPATYIIHAGTAALNGPWNYVEKACAEYDKRRKFFVNRMNEIKGVTCHMYEGAFYAYPNIKELKIPTAKFVQDFAAKEKVQISDGGSFGPVVAQGHLRIPLVKPVEVLETVTEKMERFIKSL
ncbi:aminotransferase class I/II-fold pyridoxal phosphate-dependent enzyme [Candidatus Bathyarchaeota archaeon]|nr:aminotransferase class I/II-fold pyridoxal phosphate-dependent enzyme [Candidatus Bathyarchaeota archaeon]